MFQQYSQQQAHCHKIIQQKVKQYQEASPLQVPLDKFIAV